MTDQHPDFVTDEVMEAYIYGKVMRPTTTKKEIMTYQHPLTDEICEGLSCFPFEDCDDEGIMTDMRAAADWQLKQVIEWIRRHPWVGSDCPIYDFEDKQDRSQLITDLRKAMRPQEDSD